MHAYSTHTQWVSVSQGVNSLQTDKCDYTRYCSSHCSVVSLSHSVSIREGEGGKLRQGEKGR